MISIRKYLYGSSANVVDRAVADSEAGGIYKFAAGLLECLSKHMLSEEQYAPLRLQVIQLRAELKADWTVEQGSQAVEAICRLLANKRGVVQQKAVRQAVEMQHIFAMLNEALIVLAEGKDRSIARLNRIQELLQRAGLIEDIVALKLSLSETMRFVKAESAQTQETSTREMARFEEEVGKTREFLAGARLELAGRPEGVSLIQESLRSLTTGEGLFLVAFLLDRMHALTKRYGPPVVDELVFRIIRERVRPIAEGDTTFRWTPSSLVAVFTGRREIAELRSQVNELNGSPLVHRIALGSRTAVLTVKPSHLVAEGVPGSSALLIEEVDQFTGVQP